MHARSEPSDIPSRSASKRLIAFGVCLCVVALACGGCGRRGSLEPPGGSARERAGAASAPASPRSLPASVGSASGSAPESEAVRDGDELPLAATAAGADSSAPVQTNRGAKKGFTIPKRPFILDPIL